MATQTTNLKLTKPSYSDSIDIEKLNQNMDILDSAVNEKLNKSNVNNTLTSTSTTDALSASQGKILQDGKASLSSPSFTGTPKAPVGTDYTASRLRNSYFTTTVPETLENGTICFVHEA